MGRVVDRDGIDWWDVLSLGIVPDLLSLALLNRLAQYLGGHCEFQTTRPFRLAAILAHSQDCRLLSLENRRQSWRRGCLHYSGVLSQLDYGKIAQIIEDKFDPGHAIRRRFARPRNKSDGPLILLPSAYVNVSRTAVSYAELVPEHRFLLVCARRSGRLPSLPSNVCMVSLDGYFGPHASGEDYLFDQWRAVRQELARNVKEFAAADRAGILERITSGLEWGLKVRDAWRRVLDEEDVSGCLCADDTNPYTRIPLVLAKNRGIPAIACHHGTLDSWMTLKALRADFYLAKNEMERDYLVGECRLAGKSVVMGKAPGAELPGWQITTDSSAARWLVVFTEPYEHSGWRCDEVYRDLLPRLCSLAENCGLQLVFKLHPFESIRGHRKMLRRILGRQEREVKVIAGPPTNDLWRNIRTALTVQSSTAVECAARGIPVFLLGWLRDAFSGYSRQYEKFGVGCVLESPEQIAEIPRLVGTHVSHGPAGGAWNRVDPETLRSLFSTSYSLAAAVSS
jgi:hypothetical protein